MIFASSTKRTPCGAKRSLYRGERCADYGANRPPSREQDPQEPVGGLEAQATRSFGKGRVGDEAQGSPPVVRHELEKLDATRVKRATKRELIEIPSGSHECPEPL